MLFTSRFYRRSPIWMQESLIAVRSLSRNMIRRNKYYSEVLKDIERLQWMDKEHINKYQEAAVRELVQEVVDNVPYYKKLYKDNKAILMGIKDLDDFLGLPPIEKKIVIKHASEFVSTKRKQPTISTRTSGTTGSPLSIFKDRSAIIREHAFKARQLRWSGHKPGDRMAWIRGDLIAPVAQRSRLPFWRYDRIEDMLMMSSYHLSTENAQSYIQKLEKFDPITIMAFPSSISFLGRFLEDTGKTYGGKSLRCVITSSETLHKKDRQILERVFGSRVYDWYGGVENVAAIGTCEYGNYHVIEDYGYTEFLERKDHTFEIVGTGFNNRVMPLLRYKTGDCVVLDESNRTCECGRNFRIVKEIIGRTDDVIKTKDGRQITRITPILKGVDHIAEAQFVQLSLNELDLLVVPYDGFGIKEKEKLLAAAENYLGGTGLSMRIQTVATIPRTSNRKYRTIISKLPSSDHDESSY